MSQYQSPQNENKRYRWFKATTSTTPLTGNKWVVVVGASIVLSQTDGVLLIQIFDGTASAIDSIAISSVLYGVAANRMVLMEYLPRKMLMPPGGSIQASAATVLSCVECECLEDALAIL